MKIHNTAHRTISSGCIGYSLILLICIISYSNSFHASWHLDDFPNIVKNPSVHISDLTIGSLFRASNLFQRQDSVNKDTSFRPVALFSFAINWYVGKDQVFGYHVVNFLIHVFCAGCLYLFLQSLLKSRNLIGRYEGDEKNIALLGAILWAIHPIQTQAVTYIIQRMALLSALFYLMAILCYVQARINIERKINRLCLYIACAFCLLLAMGAKENAVLLPMSLGLVEIIFFQNLSIKENRKKCFIFVIIVVLLTLILCVLLAYHTRPDVPDFINGIWAKRPFSMTERLLTEPRVIIRYLTQIFYPVLSQFSIEHFVSISTSLLKPITTLPSILFLMGVITLALFQVRKAPILSFGILFYFLNHVIESSIIPLELMFEHRNYLPSMFIFFPIASGTIKGLRYYQHLRRKSMFCICYALMVFLVLLLSITTYQRNRVWASEKTLWEDAIVKAPESSRPYDNLALHYELSGQYHKALGLYEASLSKHWTNRVSPSFTLANMARIYANFQDFDKSMALYDQSIAADPSHIQAIYDKAFALVAFGKWDQARDTMDFLFLKNKISWNDLNLMGFILLKQNAPADALGYFRQAIKLSVNNPKLFINMGIAQSMAGQYQKADWFLKQARQMEKQNIIPVFCLLDNHIKAGNGDAINTDVNELFKNFSIETIQDTLQQISQNKSMVPISSKAISSIIAESMRFRSDDLLRRE
jgi:protein O-mannosyl-transferase